MYNNDDKKFTCNRKRDPRELHYNVTTTPKID